MGSAVRRRATRKAPVFVSPCNLTRVEDVVKPVLLAAGGAYLPRPQQAAHDEVSRVRKQSGEERRI